VLKPLLDPKSTDSSTSWLSRESRKRIAELYNLDLMSRAKWNEFAGNINVPQLLRQVLE
jgi:hypothetical protein